MAYQYCSKCPAALDEPTLEQVLEDDYKCLNCGSIEDPLVSDNELLMMILSRIQNLKEKINNLSKGLE